MAESSSTSKSMQAPISRCDTPSLVVSSTSEHMNRYEVTSTEFRYFTRSVSSAAQSADVDKFTNPGRPESPCEENLSRPFQRWTSSEDQQLVRGVNAGNGPPHDWKTIAATHLANTRSPSQVSVSPFSALKFHTFTTYPYHRP